MCRNGKLLCILFELPRRIQHPLDDSADLGAKILDELIEVRLALLRRNADIDDADHLAASTEHRLIRGIETTSKQDRRAFVGFAAAEYGLRGMISRKLRADRPVAICFLQVGRAANKLLRRLVIHEERGGAADIRGGPIHNPVIAEFRHLRNFNAVNDAVSNCDLRVREGFGKRETERAEVDVDIALRTGFEVARQRPVPGSHHERSIDRDQDGRANDGLWPKVKSQESEALSLKSNRHDALSENQLNVRTYWISFTIRLMWRSLP